MMTMDIVTIMTVAIYDDHGSDYVKHLCVNLQTGLKVLSIHVMYLFYRSSNRSEPLNGSH